MRKLLLFIFLFAASTANAQFFERLRYDESPEKTIAAGAIDSDGLVFFAVDTQNDDATDDLDTISGFADGQNLTIFPASDARSIVIKDGTGNIQCAGGSDITLDDVHDRADLIYVGSLDVWFAFAMTADPGGGSFAPVDATYITQTPDATLSAEQSLSTLSSGLMRVATTTGVVTSLTDSAGVAANVDDETGSGVMVFSDNPTITTGISLPAGSIDGTEVADASIDFNHLAGDLADLNGVFNAIALDSPAVTITEAAGTVSLNLEASGGGDVRLVFSDGVYTLDCTPILQVALTAGSDISPTLNYVYVPQSTKTLTASTTGFPATEHAPIATVLVQSAASLATDGELKLHAWTDHATSSNNQGHLAHLNAWIRAQNATWVSGVDTTPTAGAGQLDVATASGVVLQLHDHAFPAFDTSTGDVISVVNDPDAAYTRVNSLTQADGVDKDSTGAALGNWYNLVLWGSVNENDGRLFANLPSSSYNNNNGDKAINDDDDSSNFSIPSAFKGTGFLIARLTIQESAGTYTVQQNEDLRGFFPSTIAGGGATGGNEFIDNVFRVQDDGDTTKQISFQASGITTGTTRELTVQDADGTIALTSRQITIAGTSNEIDSSAGAQDMSADRTWTLDLSDTLDLGAKTSFELPNSASPTTDAFGEMAGDNDAWAASRGAVQFFDGTANTILLGALASDAPNAGQVAKWNAGGTITWEDDATGGSPTLDAVGDPVAVVTFESDATSETIGFDFTSNFSTGPQFSIEQKTGTPTGGVLFEVKAASSTPAIAQFLKGTAGVEVTGSGVMQSTGVGSVLADAAATDTIDAITEIAAGLKTGADLELVTGTAGTSGNVATWDANGDLIDGGKAPSNVLQKVLQEYNPASAQSLTTTYADISGSSYTFTPLSGTSNIIYRYTFALSTPSADSPILHAKLLVDGTLETESETTWYLGNTANAIDNQGLITFEYIVQSWGTSAKTIKLQGREFDSANEAILHQFQYWDGAVTAKLRRAVLTIEEIQ